MRKTILVIFAIIILVLAIFVGLKYKVSIKPKAAGQFCKYLISYGISNGASPDYIAQNIQTIEANYPYDGQGIQTTIGTSTLMKHGYAYDYPTIKQQVQSLFDMVIKPKKLKHNLFQVLLRDPGPMMTDNAGWAQAADNFKNFAKVLYDLNQSGFGVDGILFDNEGPYPPDTSGYWYCGSSVYNIGCNEANLPAYQENARLRGRQIMQAMVESYPNIKVVFMHSADNSCIGVPSYLHNDVYAYNQLLGSFVTGMAEVANESQTARLIDGGEESYHYNTTAPYESWWNFTDSYNFRDTMPSKNCPFIPTADRSIWSSLFQKGFGLYNNDSLGQNINSIENSTKYALTYSDSFVWFYVEGVTTIGNTSGGSQIAPAWTTALTNARNTIANDPTCDPEPQPSNITLQKTVVPGSGNQGDIFTYHIVYQNSDSVASKAKIEEIIPQGMTFVSSVGGSYDNVSKKLSWSFDYIPASASGSVSFQVRAN